MHPSRRGANCRRRGRRMPNADNKSIVRRWFPECRCDDLNLGVIEQFADPEVCFDYSLHVSGRGCAQVSASAETLRAPFLDLNFCRLDIRGCMATRRGCGGACNGDAFDGMPIGSLAAATGKAMRFVRGITILKIQDGPVT